MLPLSYGVPARRFPIVNVLLIVANFAVFIFNELPTLNSAVRLLRAPPRLLRSHGHLSRVPGPDPGLDLPRALVP